MTGAFFLGGGFSFIRLNKTKCENKMKILFWKKKHNFRSKNILFLLPEDDPIAF